MVEDLLPFICGLLFNIALVTTSVAMSNPEDVQKRKLSYVVIQILNIAYFVLIMYEVTARNG